MIMLKTNNYSYACLNGNKRKYREHTNFVFRVLLLFLMQLKHSFDVLMQMSKNLISCRIICFEDFNFFFRITIVAKDLCEKIILGHLPSLRSTVLKRRWLSFR